MIATRITDPTLRLIFVKFLQLEYLNINHCVKLTLFPAFSVTGPKNAFNSLKYIRCYNSIPDGKIYEERELRPSIEFDNLSKIVIN